MVEIQRLANGKKTATRIRRKRKKPGRIAVNMNVQCNRVEVNETGSAFNKQSVLVVVFFIKANFIRRASPCLDKVTVSRGVVICRVYEINTGVIV